MSKRTMAQILIDECPVWGVKLNRRGEDRLTVTGAKCPPELAELLREHKREILDLLEAQAAGLLPDQAPWLHVAKQVLAGEFDMADSSTRESVTIGLRSIKHPVCQEALKHRVCQEALKKISDKEEPDDKS
jgi:hypothetical protein